MPELPEVQNFVYAIQNNYVGLNLNQITFHRDNLRYPFEKEKLKKIFSKGTTLKSCYREGKQLVLETELGAVNISLGMTGSFKPIQNQAPEKHQHVTLVFHNGKSLGYIDARRFGFWKIREENVSSSICDPLNSEELKQLFYSEKISKLSRSVKTMLMDQNLIGGLGNIYVCEALFRAKISPLLCCPEIKQSQWKNLSEVIPSLLKQAIEQGGSSIATYRTLNGKKGNFQNLHLVYEKHNQKCVHAKCKGLIVRIVQQGRSTWYCPSCQKP